MYDTYITTYILVDLCKNVQEVDKVQTRTRKEANHTDTDVKSRKRAEKEDNKLQTKVRKVANDEAANVASRKRGNCAADKACKLKAAEVASRKRAEKDKAGLKRKPALCV